uniref:Uncharacterized protein n=1 Tax=Nelumbo nucifera TaxID=4432 RepID=A0A822XGA1_NELNU|nr:TPA_asm: hypothetical protein HUJ06_020176 [Nelumbo nucifera]
MELGISEEGEAQVKATTTGLRLCELRRAVVSEMVDGAIFVEEIQRWLRNPGGGNVIGGVRRLPGRRFCFFLDSEEEAMKLV